MIVAEDPLSPSSLVGQVSEPEVLWPWGQLATHCPICWHLGQTLFLTRTFSRPPADQAFSWSLFQDRARHFWSGISPQRPLATGPTLPLVFCSSPVPWLLLPSPSYKRQQLLLKGVLQEWCPGLIPASAVSTWHLEQTGRGICLLI